MLQAESEILSVTSYGELYEVEALVHYPESMDELQQIVKTASLNKQQITIIGGGMSQGKQSLLPGSTLIDMRHINHMSVNDDALLTVGGGALWCEVHDFINPLGLALQVMQGSNVFSVGGSLSVNCHGWDFRTGVISNTVKRITLINAKGELQHLTPKDPLFYHVVGGYGCMGIIAEAQIQLTDNVAMKEHAEEVALSDYKTYFHNQVEKNPNILMHRYRLAVSSDKFFETGIASHYEQTSPKRVVTPSQAMYKSDAAVRKALWLIDHFPSTKHLVYNLAKRKLLKTNYAARNELMAPPVQFHFRKQKDQADWLQEFFIPESEFEPFVRFLGKTLQNNDVQLLNTTVRYIKSEPATPLGYAKEENQFAIVLYFIQPLSEGKVKKTQAWVQETIDYLIAHGGSYYLPYQHFATKEQFQACYPRWKTFKKVKKAQDPGELFSNGLYKDYFYN